MGLLGPKGAGKTTTFGMVVGLTGPDSGRVLLDDHEVTSDPMYVRARKGIGYLPQEPSIFRGLTVESNILAILETLPIRAAERWERFQRTEELMDQASFVHLRTHIWRLLRDEQPDVEALEPNGGVTP